MAFVEAKNTDKRGTSYLTNLREVHTMARDNNWDGIRTHLSALHYNEVRKIKVKLQSMVEGGSIDPEGRKKPEVIESIIAFLVERKEAGDFDAIGENLAAAVARPGKRGRDDDKGKQEEAKEDEEEEEEEEDEGEEMEKQEEEEEEEEASDEQDDARPEPKAKRLRSQVKQLLMWSMFADAIERISRDDLSVSLFDTYSLGGLVMDKEQLSQLGEALAKNTRLRCLMLPHLACGNALMNIVLEPAVDSDGLMGIDKLDLRGNDLTRKFSGTLAAFLSKCPQLRELRVEGNRGLGEKGLETVLKALPACLRVLSLGPLNDKGAVALSKWLSANETLQRLSLTGPLKEDHIKRVAKGIADGNSVQMLELGGERISDAACKTILQCESLVLVAGEASRNAALQKEQRERAAHELEGHPSSLLRQLLLSKTGYHSVSSEDHLALAMRYVAAGAQVEYTRELDEYVGSPLALACRFFGDGQMLEVLLAAERAQADERDHRGANLAMRVPKMSPRNLRLLLEHGLAVDETDPRGIPVIVVAASYAFQRSKGNDPSGWLARFQLLINGGADVKARDADGETVLTTIARTPYASVVELLLLNGADINARNNRGQTPLHCACRYGHPETVQALLQAAECDVNAVSNDGETPLDVSVRFNHGDVVHILELKDAHSGIDEQTIMEVSSDDDEHKDCIIM